VEHRRRVVAHHGRSGELAARPARQVLSLETASGWVWAIAGPAPYPDVWRARSAVPSGPTSASPRTAAPPCSSTGRPPTSSARRAPGPFRPRSRCTPGPRPAGTWPCRVPPRCRCRPPSWVPPPTAAWCSSATSRASRPPTTGRTSPRRGVGLDGHQGPAGLVGRCNGDQRKALLVERGRPRLVREAWTVALAGPPGGFSLVGFETDQQGVALAADGALWITRDGGPPGTAYRSPGNAPPRGSPPWVVEACLTAG